MNAAFFGLAFLAALNPKRSASVTTARTRPRPSLLAAGEPSRCG